VPHEGQNCGLTKGPKHNLDSLNDSSQALVVGLRVTNKSVKTYFGPCEQVCFLWITTCRAISPGFQPDPHRQSFQKTGVIPCAIKYLNSTTKSLTSISLFRRHRHCLCSSTSTTMNPPAQQVTTGHTAGVKVVQLNVRTAEDVWLVNIYWER
jgi:hypothetical protein